ncbi:unnamed protein product [Pedinophyceae sp. YPF-701]|nr:unnamed protein product [Pedinophyceae sp. YPF-701]
MGINLFNSMSQRDEQGKTRQAECVSMAMTMAAESAGKFGAPWAGMHLLGHFMHPGFRNVSASVKTATAIMPVMAVFFFKAEIWTFDCAHKRGRFEYLLTEQERVQRGLPPQVEASK